MRAFQIVALAASLSVPALSWAAASAAHAVGPVGGQPCPCSCRMAPAPEAAKTQAKAAEEKVAPFDWVQYLQTRM
ncbi:MAG TPA: hypothetical protein VLD85_06410 [Anaeromyxobacteraceae bacterium]|nr:hypothetical protein [Anaeromyxobacteraceae bacterium]